MLYNNMLNNHSGCGVSKGLMVEPAVGDVILGKILVGVRNSGKAK